MEAFITAAQSSTASAVSVGYGIGAKGYSSQVTRIFSLAIGFGVIMGSVEGSGMIVFRRLNLISWTLWIGPDSPELIGVSVAVDVLILAVLAAFLAGMGRLFPRLQTVRIAVALLGFVVFYDWAFMGGWLRHRAAVILAAGLSAVLLRWLRSKEEERLGWWRRRLHQFVALGLIAVLGIPFGMFLAEKVRTALLPSAEPNAPNILVVVVDTLRADHMSLYGYERATSPNLTRIAQQGTMFSEAFAASSWTLPSHASLLTGHVPHEHHAEDGLRSLDQRFATLPEALRSRGYRTGAFSANTIFFTRHMGLGRGFLHFEDYFESLYGMFVQTLLGRELDHWLLHRFRSEDFPGRLHAADINGHAIRWMAATRGRPFFAFLNYFDVHDPYLPPQPYRNKFSKLDNPGGLVNEAVGRNHPDLTPQQLQGEIDAYDGGVAYIDAQIGNLVAELDNRGLAQNTIVVITSDHGESLGNHGLLQHRNALYRELIRVPLVFRWPGHVPADRKVETPISNVSIAATILDLIGAEKQTSIPGPSLAQLWTNSNAPEKWPLPLSELAEQKYDPVITPAHFGWLKSLSGPQWHYIAHQKFPPQLYDWRKDPAEVTNLADTPEGKMAAQALASHLQAVAPASATAEGHTPRQ